MFCLLLRAVLASHNMEKELSTAATPLSFGFYRCRVMSCKANFYVVRSALQCFYQTNKSLRSPLPSFPMRGNSSNETEMAAKLSKQEAEEYFTRINYTGSKEPTVEVLTELHRCHILSVPFETGAPNGNFRENICSEDDLRSRIFGAFVVKFLACPPLLGLSNIYKMV